MDEMGLHSEWVVFRNMWRGLILWKAFNPNISEVLSVEELDFLKINGDDDNSRRTRSKTFAFRGRANDAWVRVQCSALEWLDYSARHVQSCNIYSRVVIWVTLKQPNLKVVTAGACKHVSISNTRFTHAHANDWALVEAWEYISSAWSNWRGTV